MINRSVFRGLFFVLGGLILSACSKTSQGPTVAKVGGASITLEDFRTRLQDTPPDYQHYTMSPEGRRQFLNLLIREKVLLVEAQKAGMQHDDAYQKQLAQFKEAWEQKLKDYQDSLLVESYLKKLRTKELSVSDADVQQYYNDHKADYDKPLQIQVSHILVNSPEEAQQVLDRLHKGESFEVIAREISKDPASAAQGGKLAPFHKGQLPAEFEDAAFKLPKGQISGIVKSSFGYHIIKKTGEKVLPAQSFDEAKDEIRGRLERDKFDHWVSAMQLELGVQVDDKVLAGAAPADASPVR